MKIKDLIINNKKVNKRIYQDKVNLSKFYVSKIEKLIGHEFVDPNSDPYLIAYNGARVERIWANNLVEKTEIPFEKLFKVKIEYKELAPITKKNLKLI